MKSSFRDVMQSKIQIRVRFCPAGFADSDSCSDSGAWACKQCGEEVRQICEDTIGTAPPEEADLSLGEWAVVEETRGYQVYSSRLPKKKKLVRTVSSPPSF